MQSCEDDPGPKKVLLTLNIDPDYFPAENDTWIFISDERGNTIDVRQAKDSIHIKFLGTPRAKVTLSILTHFEFTNHGTGGTLHSFGFNSYQGVAYGSTINLKTPTGSNLEIPDEIGNVPFTLQNYDDSDQPEYALIFTDGTSLPYSVLDYSSMDYSGNNFSSQLHLRENPSRILVATYHDDLPVHQWLNDVKPGDEITASFEDFVPSKTIPVNKQVAAGWVKTMSGSNLATGYTFSELYSRQISKSSNLQALPRLGYLDGFEKYYVSVILNQLHEKNNLYYSKAGTLPQSINLPDYTLSVNNDHLNGFSLDFSNDYSYKQAYFTESNSETQVNWNLNTHIAWMDIPMKITWKTTWVPTKEMCMKN
jgi:hypothetical protein